MNIQLEQNEETRIQKNEKRIRLWDISKNANIWIIGMPEEEKEEQKIENLFEKIMKKNFPNLVKEIDSESPREVGPKEEHTKIHHN